MSVWNDVKPLLPEEATVEIGMLFLDIADEDNESTTEDFSARLVEIFNGLYLRGWQDARETILVNINELVALAEASNG